MLIRGYKKILKKEIRRMAERARAFKILIKLSPLGKRTVNVAFMVLLLLIIVLSRYPFISLVERSWLGDDLLYVSVADNMRKGNGLASDMVIWRQILTQTPTGETTYRYEEWEEVSHLIHNTGPIYPIFLAAVFIVSSAHPPNWYFVAALANSAVVMLVIAAIYLFSLRIFDRKTALLASIAAALLPSMYWYSMSASPLIPFFLLVILAFMAASRASGVEGWLLVGALAAIAHLTHGLGILVITTFLLWCLVERRFNDSLFLMIPYIGLMLPWMIRNQLIFGDFTLGTAIPVTDILRLIGIEYGYGSTSGPSIASKFDVLQVLSNMHNELDQLYNMGYITQLLVFFAICGLYWFRNRRILVPQFIFLLLSLFGYINMAYATNRANLETRYLMPSLLVLLPLSMYGFHSIVFSAFPKLKTGKQGKCSPTLLTNIARTGTILLLLGGMVSSLVGFAADLDETNKSYAETSDEVQVHEWLRQQQLPEKTVVLTNEPYIIYLRTGLKSLYLHSKEANSTQIEWLIDRYDVDYIVIYLYHNQPLEARSQLDLLAKNPGITEIHFGQSIRLYEVGDFITGYVPPPPLELIELLDADIAILFNEMSGAIATDSSFSDKTAILVNNPTWRTQGQLCGITLNGTNQYGTLPSVSMTGDRTYAMVVSPDFLESEDTSRYLFSFRVSATNYVQVGKGNNAEDNEIMFQQRGNGGDGQQAGQAIGFDQNDIIVIVCTYDDITKVGTLYINGAARDTFTNGASLVGASALQLGRYDESFGGYWKGWLGPFVILPRVMEADEVARISEKLITLVGSSD